MDDKPPYRKWVGVLIGFLINGSAHFLSGSRAAGLKWYFAILSCSLLPILIITMPGTVFLGVGVIFWLIAIVLWFIMLKQSYRPVPRIGFLGWVLVVLINFCLNWAWAYGIRTVVQPFRVPTSAMSPTILPGDYVLVEKVTFRIGVPKRGDVVVFKTKGIASLPEDEYFVKRIAGVPGDKVRIAPPNFIVNDQVVTNPPIFYRIASAQTPFAGFQLASGGLLKKPTDAIILEKDQYLVLGDNSRNSLDSRYWGPAPRKNIVGRATRIYWPFKRIDQSLGRE
ncbi:MAG: signal peptidase I [Lentisphaerae bacterium]|nr:signal peptidase I [Lentisphaerota bacterium]